MAKKLLRGNSECEKWQKNFWEAIPSARNGKKTFERQFRVREMATSSYLLISKSADDYIKDE